MSQDDKEEGQEAPSNNNGGEEEGGEEEEERWIESDWLAREASSKEDGNAENQEDDDGDPPDVTDLFADPDPMDTFQFTWTIIDVDDDEIDNNNESSTSAAARSRCSIKKRTIDIRLEGYKAELGQTLHSTGLTLWRASQILSNHLVTHAVRKEIYGKRVIELGAGMGLCGILAFHLGAKSVLLTDGDTDALAQLRRNVQANCSSAYCDVDKDDNDSNNNKGHNRSHDVTCRQLVWGRNLDNFVSEHGVFDVILGSDIIYVEEIIEPLFETIERIMNPQADADATFILAYARRNVPVDLVLDHAKTRGFEWTHPDESSAEGIFCFKRCATREG